MLKKNLFVFLNLNNMLQSMNAIKHVCKRKKKKKSLRKNNGSNIKRKGHNCLKSESFFLYLS